MSPKLPRTSPAANIFGVLPDWAIIEHIKARRIVINPEPKDLEKAVQGISLDFTLGNIIKVFRKTRYSTIDIHHTTKEQIEQMMETILLKKNQPFVLEPGDFAIATTAERLKLPKDITGRLDGRSSLARLGIVVHSTAARFDPGWDGKPVLEFGTFLPDIKVILYEGERVCAFSFERLQAAVKNSYNGKYGSDLPDVSAITDD